MTRAREHAWDPGNLRPLGENCEEAEFADSIDDEDRLSAPCWNEAQHTCAECVDSDEDAFDEAFDESAESYRAKDVVISVSEHNMLRSRHRANKLMLEKYDGFTVEDLIREYHDKETPKNTKQWLKEEVFFRTFFLLPYVAKKTWHITAAHFDDAMQNMASNLLTAIDKFKPELNYAFVDYLAAYLKAGVTKTFRDTNIVSVPSARRKLLREAMSRKDDGGDSAVREAVSGLAITPVSYPSAASYDEGSSWHSRGSDDGDGRHKAHDFDEIVHNLQLVEWLEEALSVDADVITADERRVLVMHYGLFGHKPQTYKEIAKLHKAEGKGHACSRLSQISTQAIKKLRVFFGELGLEEY